MAVASVAKYQVSVSVITHITKVLWILTIRFSKWVAGRHVEKWSRMLPTLPSRSPHSPYTHLPLLTESVQVSLGQHELLRAVLEMVWKIFHKTFVIWIIGGTYASTVAVLMTSIEVRARAKLQLKCLRNWAQVICLWYSLTQTWCTKRIDIEIQQQG